MDMRVGFVILFVLGASWACDVRHVEELSLSVQEGEPQSLKEFSGNENVCTLCEEFASQALDYISENKTQTEIIEYLHNSCSQLKSLKQQLEIIEILLKACNSVENYVKKSKRLVFQYGPLILVNAEEYLEKTDICTALHACNPSTVSLGKKIYNGIGMVLVPHAQFYALLLYPVVHVLSYFCYWRHGRTLTV